MASRSEDDRNSGPGYLRSKDFSKAGEDALVALLARAVHSAVRRLSAPTAAVYLIDDHRTHLNAAVIGGGPPSAYTLPARMPVGASSAPARALVSGRVEVVLDPDLAERLRSGAEPYPYVSIGAPVVAPGRRFGALAVLRPETDGDWTKADVDAVRDIGDTLASELVSLAEDGIDVVAGLMPVIIPAFSPYPSEADRTRGWGAVDLPGSAGMSLIYPMRGLANMLNEAMSMDDIVRAAHDCVMVPFGAQALLIVASEEGRLWVLGHTGNSSGRARHLHGVSVHNSMPAATAVRANPGFLIQRSEADTSMEVYLSLRGSRHAVALVSTSRQEAAGTCCLTFSKVRDFSPDERAILSMMAGSLGAAVERVRLSTRQRAAAETLQAQLLPPKLADLPGLITTARYRPAMVTSEVGGDWYDVIRLPGDRVVLVVGDVEGHSMESAAAMGQVRSAVFAYVTEGHRPSTVLDRTNSWLAAMGTDLLVTCCVIALNSTDGMVEVALAGHPEPLVRLPDGNTRTLSAPANVPLGVGLTAGYEGREHTLEPEAVVMLFSDGLLDWSRPDPPGDARSLLSSDETSTDSNDLERLADRILASASETQDRSDDAVLLLAQYKPTNEDQALRSDGLQIPSRDLHGVQRARRFVGERMSSWGLASMTDDLQLVVSEIVTNALVHAGGDVELHLRVTAAHVRLEVRDSESNPPIPTALSMSEEERTQAEHGRGLFIVDALTEGWNSSPNGRGKTVSLNMPIPNNANAPPTA
ncbi:SpoIIE family protein phosphatase [Streptomyces sp. NPDC060030]|uniref:SpoIIE family protein phosphatase n=1 Tax=Streptomyces sp. NPDC060030 TaxID=3347042 RepID=UPI0036B4D630